LKGSGKKRSLIDGHEWRNVSEKKKGKPRRITLLGKGQGTPLQFQVIAGDIMRIERKNQQTRT